ncbi:ABC transporter ATP-binding protein [Elioraea tepida]|nr:ABC transporter ATP-binding protein [Elioraea tepida]
MSAVLAVENLVVRMGAQTILHGVSLAVPEGSIVTVLGSNGVGKTTLMRALSGVYRVSSGTIRLMGEDITGLPSHAIVRRGLAQAPEGRQIFGAMTVAENLRLGAVGAVDPALLEQVLGMFPILRERYRQRAGSLSGGEQQMLCVGRALMARPKLLLMDEPSLGLAPKLVKQIFDLIVTIRCEGTPVLLVEQNARAALAIADYAYVMDGGRIVLEGPARELARDDRVKAAYLGGHAHA